MRQRIKHITMLLILAFSLPALAAGADECGEGPAFAGKPISLLSGVETFSRRDLALGGLYPITVRRQYNSRTAYDSPLGYGWALNYEKRLYTYPDGSVTVRKDCGTKRLFAWSVGGYITPVGEVGTLVLNADGTYTYTTEFNVKENYDERGRLASMVDSHGNSLVFTYASLVRDALWGLLPFNIDQSSPLIVAYDYRLSRIEEKDAAGSLTGAWAELHYDTMTGRLTGITDSAGRTVAYGHDSVGNLNAVSGPGLSASYGYSDANNKHRLTSIDEGQGAYVNTYDARGKVTRQTHAGGIIDIEYLEHYKKTKVTTTVKDGAGAVLNTSSRTVEFNGQGQMIKETDTFGNVINYVRNTSTWITREEHRQNTGTVTAPVLVLRRAMDFTYDTKGNMLTRIDTGYATDGTTIQSQKTTTWTYHPTFNKVATETVKSVVDPNQNRVITNTYDEANGNLMTTTETGLLGNGNPYTYVTTYAYYPNGKLQSIDGPRTDVTEVTSYTYTTQGYIQTTAQPLIGTMTYSNHDALGNPRTVTDPNGNSTIYTYDTTGRVSTVKAPGDTAATQYFYVSGCGQSCSGKLDHIVLPEGNTIWYTYDTFGNLITIRDSMNNSINYTYDSEGNRLTEDIRDASGALQKSLGYQYDALNRLKKVVNPDSSYTEYSYDFRGNKSAIRNPNANTTAYQYDTLNRLVTVFQPGNVDTVYGYDTNNNLTSVQDDNTNTTQYKYDDKGRVYQVISPDTGTTTYQYDPAGNMTSKTDAKGVTISYQYDALNRLTKIDFPTDTDIVYSYDSCVNGKGRLCSMTDASGTTSYEYWPKGQVKKETKVLDGVTYVTQYSYDQNGNLKTMTYPSGRVITYSLSNDKVIAVLNNAANLAANITYKPFGGLTSLTYGNGIVGTISYDNQYRVTGITAGAVMNLGYPTYDANGNITGITNNLDPTKNKTFGYDALDRLTSATASGIWGSLSWTYDGVGNRLTENGNAYTYHPNTNKLSSANGVSYGYDNDGNTTMQGTRQYIYNQNQRLIQVNDGSITANYTYNGHGQRVKKVVNGVATVFHYNLRGQIIAESDSTGSTTAEYVYLYGQPLAKIEGANVYYYANDHLGTPQKMIDAAQQIVWSGDMKPFGETISVTGSATDNLGFPGEYIDAETGLHYNYLRDHNPADGRFIESDPIGILKGRNHLYVRVGGNPIRRIDMYGLQEQQCDPHEKKCRDKAQTAYNDCMKQITRVTTATDIGSCIKDGVVIGVVVGAATLDPLLGGIAGTGYAIICVWPKSDVATDVVGEGNCRMLAQRIYDTCKADPEQ